MARAGQGRAGRSWKLRGQTGGIERDERLRAGDAAAGPSSACRPNVALIGFVGAPWTAIATYMVEGGSSRDFARVKRWAFADPNGFARLMDCLVSATTSYLLGQIEAGAEALQLFDSWAGVLPEAEFRRWVIEPTARIVRGVKARYPAVPIIGFPRGAGLLHRVLAQRMPESMP